MTLRNPEGIFDSVTREAERQRVKHPEHGDAIDAAAKKIQALVKDGKLEENFHARRIYQSASKALGSQDLSENPL